MLLRAANTAIVLFGLMTSAFASGVPPKIRRVCLDRINMTANLYWTPSSDTCSTFLRYQIWGRDDVNGVFVTLGSKTAISTGTATVSLPNLKRWQFFIVAHYGCNPADSLISDTLFVDDSEPVPMDLDSVSIDRVTQKVIAGWKRNPSSDLQGYFLYKVGASNQIIADTNATSYTFRNLNEKTSGNRISISAYDSCFQAGLISAYHEPVLLSIQDSTYCLKRFSLQFSAYVGWPVARYEVYLKTPQSLNHSKFTSVPGSGPLSFNLILPSRNQTYQCYVRAYNVNGTISSSSNIIMLRFDSLPSHSVSYIRKVSQINDNLLISSIYDNPNGEIQSGTLEYSLNGSTWNFLKKSVTTSFNATISNNPPQKHYFRLVLNDQCANSIISSNVSNNIVLNKTPGSIEDVYWNNYSMWLGGVDQYYVLSGPYNMNVSTWNTIDQYSTVPPSYTLPASFPKQNCLCILAVEKGPNPLGYKDSSYSNIICPYEINDLYIPNAFTPNADGKNEAFKPNAPNLNPATSMLIIYNRWGSVVFKGNTLLGWDGSDTQKAVCPAGVYAYTLDAVSLNGSRKLIQGTVHLIR